MAGTKRKGGSRQGSETSDLKVVIAVDFGTTFSGVAYANTYEPENPTLIKEWDEGLQGEKVPTVLKYSKDETTLHVDWGYKAVENVRPGDDVREWFKLGLCPEAEKRAAESELLRDFPNLTVSNSVLNASSEELVVEYLTKLRQSTDEYFKKYDSDVYELEREYIITVPAMWSDRAKRATRDCAARAGIGSRKNLQIIAEPEAAGIYALASKSRITLHEGNTFVICDAGGGTVDLTSYRVKSLKPFIALEGVSIPSGDLCGSIFLNRIFEHYLKKKLKGYIDKWERRELTWFKSVANHFEENIKKKFTGDDMENGQHKYYHFAAIGLPDSPKHGIEGDELKISAKDIRKKVFDPVIANIQDLVRNHLEATGDVKEVLLAGGFGENAYLMKRLRETAHSFGAEVNRIKDSRTAIVRGALIAGLAGLAGQGRHGQQYGLQDHGRINVRVTSRKAPRCYGVRAYKPYEPSNPVHRNCQNPRDCVSGKERIELMEWLVKKGEVVEDGVPKICRLFFDKECYSYESAPSLITCEIYAYEDEPAPNYPHSTRHPCPDLDVMEVPRVKKDGSEFYEVDFEVHMTLQSARLNFVLDRNNKKYDPKDVTFT